MKTHQRSYQRRKSGKSILRNIITPEQKNRIVSLKAEGLTNNQIAEQMKLKYQSIYSVLTQKKDVKEVVSKEVGFFNVDKYECWYGLSSINGKK